MISRYTILLADFGFHSEKKRLKGVYSREEICNIVIDRLTHSNIVSIEPKIVNDNGNAPACEEVEVQANTAESLISAINALRAQQN